MDRSTIGRTIVALCACAFASAAAAQALPPGFARTRTIANLEVPTAVRFAHDGRVYVAEKKGVVLEYDTIADTTPTVVVDLRTKTHDWADRGLLGLALDPDYPERPFLYVAYTYDGGFNHQTGVSGPSPRWGSSTAATPDPPCPPPGSFGVGTGNAYSCPVSGRISRLDLSTSPATETVLVHDFYQQFSSHSIGTVMFGPDGYLYAGGGDGASFVFTDYGQNPNPSYPDGGSPTDEGGSLRAQDIRTSSQSGDTLGLAGALIRIDPNTGAGAPGNPLASSSNANERRMLAYGMRNPFRFTMRPGTNEIWMGDVGADDWDEINVLPDPNTSGATTPRNFGWPCYEGNGPQENFEFLGLPMCDSLYGQGSGAVAAPFYTYKHVDANCVEIGSAPSGIVFHRGTNYPSPYAGALFFADYNRFAIFALPDANADGVPEVPTQSGCASAPEPSPYRFAQALAVDLVLGPGSDVYYVEIAEGAVDRVHFGPNRAPAAAVKLAAGSTFLGGPRTVSFTASAVDPDGDTVSYAWDLDADGAFDDATGASASVSVSASGAHPIAVRATDVAGGVDVARMRVRVAGAPTPVITQPGDPAPLFAAFDTINVAGTATDPEDGTLPPSALSWAIDLAHCSDEAFTDCHFHPQTTFTGASGSFTAPQHAYPAFLRVRLTATDSSSQSATVERRIFPRVATLAMRTVPTGLTVLAGEGNGPTPFDYKVIVNTGVTVIAPATQTLNGQTYAFVSWSDGGPRVHEVTPSAEGTITLTATYQAQGDPDPIFADGFE